jgi:FkbM family methyltransferase
MKIAYIFFGQVKNFERHQFDAFRENVQSKICDHDIEYHLVTSKRSKYGTPRQQRSEGTENAINHHTIKKYFDFKNIFYDELDSIDCSEIEDLAENLVSNFGGAWGEDSLQATINSLKQIYSLEFFYNQFSKLGEDYDAYILSRSDLFHTHPIDADCLSRNGDIFIPYYDALPQIDYGWFGGVNDRFAIIKNQSALKTYCTRYSSIKNNPQFYHAEKYLKQKLEFAKTDIQKIHNFEFKFLRGNGKITDQIGIYPDANMNTNLNKISKSFFINLDRRTDRLNHINNNLPFFANRFSAVDGNSANLDEEVKTLFPKTWQKRTKAEICCAISHYRLWKQLVFDNDAHNYLILEDDVVFKPGVEKFWNDVFSHKMPSDFSIIYLGGCQPWNRPHYHKVLQKHNEYFCTVKKNDYFTTGDHFWHMNASSYIMSRQAAMLICQWVEQQGMDEALDNFMQNFFNKNKLFTANNSIYHLNPLIAYQLHEEGDNFEADKNSDIRHSKEKFTESSKEQDVCLFEIEKVNIILPKDNQLRHEFYKDFPSRAGCEVILRSLVMYLYDQGFLNKSKSIVDLGAWIGDNAVPWAKFIEGNVYAIDPSEENIEFINELKNLNSVENLKTIKSAVSDKDKILYFSGDEKHITFEGQGDKQMQARSLDSFYSEGVISDIGFLHLDVEGQEYNVLLGSQNIIQECTPLIVWENHLCSNDYRLIIDMLELRGYKTFLINEFFPHCGYDCRNFISIHASRIDQFDCDKINLFFRNLFKDHKFNANQDLLIAKNFNSSRIPRKIFQTWEVSSLGSSLNTLSTRIQERNTNYDYHLFDAEQRRLFIEKNFESNILDCYDRIIPGAFKADLWRYCVLYKLGGVYCDIDMLSFASFDYLIFDDIDFFAPIDFPRKNRGNLLTNGMFGCEPGCEIVKNCIDIIVDHVQNETWHKNQTEDIIYDYLNFAGPAVLGRAVNRFLDRDENTSFGKNYGIIEHKNKRIKLIEFSDGDEHIKDAHGKVIVQNKNGNEKLKRMIDEEMPSYGLKHWGEQLGLDRKPYISDAVKINPTAVRHHEIEYVLYRTESYPGDCPCYYKSSSGKRIDFYRSNAGYQLKIGESKTIDCTFDFGDYSYVKSKMIDLAGTSRMKIEDVRFVENAIESNNGELSCLACCTILSDIDVFEGQKKEDGSWDEKKPIGLKLKTSPGICRVNLNTGEIQYIRTLTNQSDDIQKNWLMFKHDDLYYCLYSVFPLLYCAKESIEQIEFSQQEKRVVPKMHNATCPIKIDDNSYAMICHSERQHVEQKPGSLPWAYKKYFVSFDLENGEITNIYSQELDNIKPEYYCSSILKDGDRLKVFAGVEDVDCVEFSVDIPRSKKSKPTHKLIFTQKNLFEQDFLLELFDDVEIVYDMEMTGVYENACIVYSDIYHRDSNVYKNEEFRKTLNQQKQKLFNFLNQQKNCCLVHLSDEHRHAEIDHYKNFKHVFRQYYRSDAAADNVTFIPLGYKSGFHDQ